MRLHENEQLFKDAISFASQSKEDGGLGISPLFIEKDYWICRSLKLMVENDPDRHAIFKGGTSLTKAYDIGARFSEDIDIAISEAWTLSGNQLKNLIKRTSLNMSKGLEEIVIQGKTSKGSHYHKAYYKYPSTQEVVTAGSINHGQILIEINAFANPYPSHQRSISSFLTQFLEMTGREDLIAEYGMQAFEVPVLDKSRTLTEKLVSLMRCSLATDYRPQLIAKIRHFYDLHFLLQDEEIQGYLTSDDFLSDFNNLLEHDRAQFDKPEGWQDKPLSESPLLTDFPAVWAMLEPTYLKELPDLAYDSIPTSEQIVESVTRILSLIG